MIIVSDTTLFSNFLQIGELDILRKVHQQVFIPPAVHREVLKLENRVDLSDFLTANWIKVQAVNDQNEVKSLLDEIDLGESEAIILAKETNADLILTDDKDARKVAQRMGFKISGTIGVLLDAKNLKVIIAIKPFLDAIISKAGFRISSTFYNKILLIADE